MLTLRGVRTVVVEPGGGRREVLRGVDLDVRPGAVTGLVGPSGGGKSTLARVCVGLTPVTEGSVLLPGGTDLATASRRRVRALRPRLQLVFQDPWSAFTPGAPVGAGLVRQVRRHRGLGRSAATERVVAGLADVGLGPEHLGRRPDELSGGQLQRVAIARALLADPWLLVADEVVSALDLATQDAVVTLLRDLCRERGIALLFVSHDLALVGSVCDEVAVLGEGLVVEHGPVAEVVGERCHPLTRALFAAVPTWPPPAQR